MPRPQRPRPNRLIEETTFAEVANLFPEDYRARLKAEVMRLVDDYRESWTPRDGPGRRDEAPRNALIIALAKVFQARSGWDARDPDVARG